MSLSDPETFALTVSFLGTLAQAAINGRDQLFADSIADKLVTLFSRVTDDLQRHILGIAVDLGNVQMKAKLAELKRLEMAVLDVPDQQISLTDPDARAMATSMRGAGVVGYNVQAAGILALRRRRILPSIPLVGGPLRYIERNRKQLFCPAVILSLNRAAFASAFSPS